MADKRRSNMVLFTQGDWSIIKGQRFLGAVVQHQCYPKTHSPYPASIEARQTSICWRCQVEIPGGVVAIWKFMNWEDLEGG